jgi:hypothetical protein
MAVPAQNPVPTPNKGVGVPPYVPTKKPPMKKS